MSRWIDGLTGEQVAALEELERLDREGAFATRPPLNAFRRKLREYMSHEWVYWPTEDEEPGEPVPVGAASDRLRSGGWVSGHV